MASGARPSVLEQTGVRPSNQWMALVGTVMYLLEFAFIFPFWKMWPEEASPMELVEFWNDNETAISTATIGVSMAVLGRVVYAAALRDVLRQQPKILAYADLGFALAVMAVTVEIVALTFTAISARMAASSESAAAIADSLVRGYMVDTSVATLLAASVVVFSVALLRSRLLKPWIGWVGLVGGAGYALSIAAPFDSISVLSDGVAPIGWVLVVVWMFAVSISLVRAGSRTRPAE